MKIWLSLALSIILFIALGYSGQNYLKHSSKELDQKLKTTQAALTQKDWKLSLTRLRHVERSWNTTKNIWAMFTHHQEIDYIEQAMTKAKEAIIGKSYADARMELQTMRHFLNHTVDREKFNWVNIF